MRVYLDSCIVIYLIEGTPTLRQAVRDALGARAEAQQTLCVSPLVRLESRIGPLKARQNELLAQFESFFAHPAVANLSIRDSTFDLATDLRAQHGLKTPDALHLATALENGCEELWTNDGRFAKVGIERVLIRILPPASAL